ARRVDRIIAMDKLMRDYIKDRYNLSSSVVRFIPAGVDVERFQRVSGNRVRSLYGLSLRDPIILSLGTVSSLRTANGLLKALPRVLRQFASVRLLFVGALYDKGPLELVKKLRLDNSVIFCGRIDYQMIPSYVGASDVEGHDLDTGLGIGLASLEAMAAGRAVLSSAGEDNFMELRLKNWESIALVEPGNVRGISNALVKLLSDRKLRERIGRNAKAYVRNNFSLEVVCQKYESVYRDLIK
ncbi:MAG: glycosyltransferase family 4 protein, partial [Candidatus Bathyarchaeia archaeon]